jgi:hypothetical protein
MPMRKGIIIFTVAAAIWGAGLIWLAQDADTSPQTSALTTQTTELLAPIQTAGTTTKLPYFDAFSDEQMTLVNNADAVKATWEEVKTFLINDNTDEVIYGTEYSCAGAAMRVHNNAESAGIKTGVAIINFLDDDSGHVCNVFDTADYGLVYIDCTPPQEMTFDNKKEETFFELHPIENDRVAYIQTGEDYGLVDITRAQSFSYSFYVNWMVRWEYYAANPQDGYDDSLGPNRWASPGIVEDIKLYW